MPAGCCKDVKFFSKADCHEKTTILKTNLKSGVDEAIIPAQPTTISTNYIPFVSFIKYHPPDIPGLRIHLLNGVLRI